MISQPELSSAYIGSYRINRVLGQGNYGIVYHATQPFLDRQVAIKVIDADLALDEYTETHFIQEARTVAGLRHPNIVAVHEFGFAEKKNKTLAFMVMEYLPGTTLQSVLKLGRPTTELTIEIAEQLADALDYAHANNIIHRDLKPANIIFSDRNQPVIVDFGLAKLVEISSSRPGTEANSLATTAKGTPAYMSPEQAQGQYPTPASDQYSLGLIVYEMLSGQRPFNSDTAQGIIAAKMSSTPPPLSAVAPQYPALASVVLGRALSIKPEDRFPTASAFIRALTEVLLPDRKIARVVTVTDPIQAAQLRSARQTILGFIWGLILLTLVIGLFCGSLFLRGYLNMDRSFIWDGIVASNTIRDGYHDVIGIWPGGPAQQAGVQVGDRIQTDIFYDMDVRDGDYMVNKQARSSYPANWQPQVGDLIERAVIRNGQPVEVAYHLELSPFNLIIFFVQFPVVVLAFICAIWLLRRWGAEPGVTLFTMGLMAGSFAIVASGVTNVIKNIDSVAVMILFPLLLHLMLIFPEPLHYFEVHPRQIWLIYLPFPFGIIQFLVGLPVFYTVDIILYAVYMLVIIGVLVLKWGRHDLRRYPALWWLILVWIIAGSTLLLGEGVATFDDFRTVQTLWAGNGLILLAVDYGLIIIGASLAMLLGTIGVHRLQVKLGMSLPTERALPPESDVTRTVNIT